MCHSCVDTGRVVYGSDTESGRVEEPCRECGKPYRGRCVSVFKGNAGGKTTDALLYSINKMLDSASAPDQPVRLKLDSGNKEGENGSGSGD